MNQPSLDFTQRPIIPPLFRDTSLEAADAMADRAPILRARVLGVLAIRPRVTELANNGRIADTGERRKNASGRKAIVWRLVEAMEAA